MSDYISREALLKRRHGCNRNCSVCDFATDGDSWCEGELFVVDALAIPAADVRENKKRYWYEDEAGCAICSECREYAFETSTHHISGWFPRFCPNCGADMREEQT